MKVEQPRIFVAHLTTAYWIQSNALFPPSDKEVEDVWQRIWRGRGVGSMRLLDDTDTPIPFPIHHAALFVVMQPRLHLHLHLFTSWLLSNTSTYRQPARFAYCYLYIV